MSDTRGHGTTSILEATDIVVAFGGLTAIDGVSIALSRGEILGLIGPNGAGKTTFVNVLTGFQRPSRGQVRLDGTLITGLPAHRVARAGLSRTFQAVRLFRDLTVLENLEAAAVGSGCTRAQAKVRANAVLAWMLFAHKGDHRADSLPYGEERRVGIARALAMAPKFVLLDEPAAGLADAECDDLMGLIRRMPAEHGCGVLLIEHNMRVVMGVCDRIHVIDVGRTIAEGTPEEIQRHPEVLRAYLGHNGEENHARA
ncbi:MAG: ABC transporter ATP-binding protein [Alphaproteobacteria bacterium]|nr:ABC transporter ATP-binding protein [Alphaproteobacteria bacterium]